MRKYTVTVQATHQPDEGPEGLITEDLTFTYDELDGVTSREEALLKTGQALNERGISFIWDQIRFKSASESDGTWEAEAALNDYHNR